MRAGRILALVVALTVSIGSAEAILRLMNWDPNPSPTWKFHPVYGWTMDPAQPVADEVNENGFRGPRAVSEAGAGEQKERRALVLGDSFTAGTSLPYAQTFPSRLRTWLERTSGDRWAVVAAAVDDWGQAQQLLAMRDLLPAFQPEVVVVQTFPLNDLGNNTLALGLTLSLQDEHRPYFLPEDGGGLRASALHPWRFLLRSNSRLFGLAEAAWAGPVGNLPSDWLPEESDQDLRRRAFFRERARRAGLEFEGAAYALLKPGSEPPQVQEGWEATRRILAAMKQESAVSGAALVGLVVPFLKSFGEDWGELEAAFQAPIVRHSDTDRFESLFEEMGVPVVSLRRRIEGGGAPVLDYFLSPTDGHLSPFGHEAAAQEVAALYSRDGSGWKSSVEK